MIESTLSIINSNLVKLTDISLLIFGGFFFRFLLQSFGQAWIMTKAHTSTIIILPIVTYVITNVISGNIALSLGMVGALSIVRFRNPVRSPLELSTYFASITMGIAASVSSLWLVFLIFSVTFAVVILMIVDSFFSKIFNKPLFIASFSEGNSLSTLNIQASESISICEKNPLLQSKIKTNDSITYSFASINFSDIQKLEENREVQSKADSIELKR